LQNKLTFLHAHLLTFETANARSVKSAKNKCGHLQRCKGSATGLALQKMSGKFSQSAFCCVGKNKMFAQADRTAAGQIAHARVHGAILAHASHKVGLFVQRTRM